MLRIIYLYYVIIDVVYFNFIDSSSCLSINSQNISDAYTSMDIETSIIRIQNSLKSCSSEKTQGK